jgi:hypothetical protein
MGQEVSHLVFPFTALFSHSTLSFLAVTSELTTSKGISCIEVGYLIHCCHPLGIHYNFYSIRSILNFPGGMKPYENVHAPTGVPGP